MWRALPVLLLSLACLSPAQAENPVHFPDARLKAAVEEELWISDPTPTDMLGLTSLTHPNSYSKEDPIRDLTGLQYAANLQSLNLRYHDIGSLSPLSGLTRLQTLILLGNRISDISPLSGLSNLETLDLEQNQISNISALAGLSQLQSVGLHRNFISDISPLVDLTDLSWVDLRANPLGQDAYDVQIARIRASNPGIALLYDAPTHGRLVVSSAIGGSVIRPGEGVFSYEFYDGVVLEARPDPGFVFVNWSGDTFSTDNPLILVMDQDYTLQANFRSTLATIHVDDDAPGDPAPGNPVVSDPRENGTPEHPFDRIQEAIDVAGNGTSIFVHSGTYRETIELLGKHITLTGFGPNDSDDAEWPVIDGDGAGPVVSFTHREDANCVLAGLVITGGSGRSAGAILCSASSPTIVNCLIAGNRANDGSGAAIRCTDSRAAFVNCTISGNQAGKQGAALYLQDSPVTVVNSILWDNAPAEVLVNDARQPVIRCSVVAGGWPGPGCIDADPLFARPGRWSNDPGATWVMGDYHLQSQTGRWEPTRRKWMLDQRTSPCIDAGDLSTLVGEEPLPNGGIINMGAYGGTAEASKSGSDGPVYFPDANLKAAVEQELWIVDPTPTDMLGLTQLIRPNLYTRESAITNLTGLEYAVNLRELNLRYHGIRDVTPLSGLTNVQTMSLLGNYITDISPLAKLSGLRTLDLEQNKISSIAALAGLSNLESVGLHRNFITDISPLSNLTHLIWVDLRANPMNQDAYGTLLSQIRAHNPGMTLLYDAPFTGRLTVSCTAGGSVIHPGVGVFTYGFYEVVVLEAQADPGFEFIGWSGDYSTQDNPLFLTMDQDYSLQANFRSK